MARNICPPVWADDLIRQVCDDHALPVPDIQWRRLPEQRFTHGRKRNGTRTTWVYNYDADSTKGRFYYPSEGLKRHPNGLLIVEARDDDAIKTRKTVLHELAHMVAGAGKAHGVEFYVTLYGLVERYGEDLTLDAAYAWERDYKSQNAVAGMRQYLRQGWAQRTAA